MNKYVKYFKHDELKLKRKKEKKKEKKRLKNNMIKKTKQNDNYQQK